MTRVWMRASLAFDDAQATLSWPKGARRCMSVELATTVAAAGLRGPRRRALGTGNHVSFPSLYVILDADLAARAGWSVPDLARACLRGGAKLFQVRAKALGAARFLETAREVVSHARAAGALVIVNDRADLAVLSGADGVHVGQEDLAVADVRRLFRGLAHVGLSTHTPPQVAQAVTTGATYVAVGPVFGTTTKQTGYAAVGLDLVSEACRVVAAADGAAPRPVVAIGGITLERAPDVLAAGASSVAVISDILSSGDPEARVRAYVERLGDQPIMRA
jgi:thiamine-phosphate pyrophosphorylase